MKHNLIIDSDGKATRRPIPSFASRLGAAMALPLRRRLDYAGIARKALHVEQLPPGALPIYDRDIDVVGALGCFDEPKTFKHDKYTIRDDGKAGRRRIVGQVVLPKFEVYSNPTIRIADVKQRRFNLIDRSVQTARQQIMSQEDSQVFKALDDAVVAQPEKKKESFWCDGCGEPRYKCYCDEVCPYCPKKLKDCIGDSETGECPNKPGNNQE